MPGPSGEPLGVEPPRVAESVQAVYPEQARALGLAGAVTLLVTIAVDGAVLEAGIVEPAGHGFDEAALEAVRRFRFEPARRDGQPIAARIRYRYVFEPPVATTAEAAPTVGRIAGTALSDADGKPIAGAHVVVTEVATGRVQELEAGTIGGFALEALPPGRYHLTISSPGFVALTLDESVRANEETALSCRLVLEPLSDTGEDPYGARAVIAPPPREVTRRTLERSLLFRIPGTGNDPIRAVEILPGVSRPPFGNGILIIRGASPADSQSLVDGVPLPQLYHFGGLRSVYSGQMLRQVSLYPGNFSSRFGRKTGGIFELETRDPQTDRLHGVVDVSPIDGSLLLEGPITKKLSIMASVRRSLFDLALRALTAGRDTGFTAVPSYYDYQFMGSYRPTPREQLRLQFYGSNDRLGLLTSGDNESNAPAAANAVDVTSRFNLFQASWRRPVGSNTEQYITVQAGPTSTDVGVGESYKLELHNVQVYGRAEWLTRVADGVRLVSGLDVNTGSYRATYVGPPIGQSEGNPNTPDQRVGAKAHGGIFQPGAYVDLALDLGPVTLNGAVRADYYQEIQGYSIDPRLIADYRFHPHWSLRWG
ncbi:MAG: uncharacterized protein JWN48_3358, partial [Myxococcaceae bacterium]|nr:uncharacterized protein [Myxococcaceae bacterium]